MRTRLCDADFIDLALSKVQVDPATLCWNWTGAKTPAGYGKMTRDRKTVAAHRFMWATYRGPIQEGECVLHRCDNPSCCNPDHLFIGSQRDNVADMHEKGRAACRGPASERANFVKLTPEKVREIRGLAARGLYQREIAQMYGVTQPLVGYIVRRETWKNVD